MKSLRLFTLLLLLLSLGSCLKGDGEALFSVSCFEIQNEGAIKAGDEIFFSNCSKGGEYYLWEFGFREVSFEKEPTYTYTEPGEYEVVLVVQTSEPTDIDGDGLISANDRLPKRSDILVKKITVQ